ncbi:MAG: tetratricopeptide repeat protein [Spirochaetales bacterium]
MNNLPKVNKTHIQEKNSYKKLANILPSELFILRSEDGGDYGVDKIIEVIKNGNATNIRSHVQVKSTHKKNTKSQGLSYQVPIITLNYLLNSLNSLFVVFDENNNVFYWEWIGIIENKRNASKSKCKKKYSYLFTSILDESSLDSIHSQLINDSDLVKGINLTTSPFEKVIITEQIHESNYREYLKLFISGKYEKVIALIKEKKQASAEENSLVSLCYYNIYNYDEALKYILKAELIEKNDHFQRIKTIILCEKGIKEKSRETLISAKKVFLSIQSDSWSWMDLYNYGNLLSGLEEYEEAEKCYKKALKIEPKEAMIFKNLSSIYYHAGNFDLELNYLDQALSIDENLIEALICKGISLGNNYKKYDEAITILQKALNLNKDKINTNDSIYYWISVFYNALNQYEKSLKIIEEALINYPGNNYLGKQKLQTLILLSNTNTSFEKQALDMLETLTTSYPKSVYIKIEQLKILSRTKPRKDLLSIIKECFNIYKYSIDTSVLDTMSIEQIIYMIQNFDTVLEYRNINNIGSLFFEEYNIGIAKVQSFEMKMNVLFLSLYTKYKELPEKDLMTAFEEYVKQFMQLSVNITEVLVSDLLEATIKEKSEKITQIITTLPKILLIELSRQNGWILQKHNFSIDIADKLIENSNTIHNWFDKCLEPILLGANNILKWSKE